MATGLNTVIICRCLLNLLIEEKMMIFKKPVLPRQLMEVSDISALRDCCEENGGVQAQKLQKLNVCDEDFGKVDFSEVLFSECRFKDCCFRKVSFVKAVIENCQFINCNFEDSFWKGCWIQESKVSGCTMVGSIFKETVWKEGMVQYANCNECRFENVFWDESRIVSSELSECRMKGLKMNRAVLTESNFFKTMLNGTDFTSSDISGITLSGDFRELRGAVINGFQAADLVRQLGIKVED